ncbi:hypothetical protein AB0F52_27210 [Amycolatopsis sp. NPDC024027]|uniref:hypothetical protein n=1 Tax=Amycolatopsis sp. NPDC024027 TaxID=3154327 RepID=UPI0034108BCA
MNEVFGVSRDLPLNYVERDKVDNKLFLALAQNHHIVIHGSSKQGKTCLRKWNIKNRAHAVVACIEIRTVAELNAAILKAVGYKVEKSQSVTVSGKHRVTARLDTKIPVLGKEISGSLGREVEKEQSRSTVTGSLDLDLEDINDMITALDSIKTRTLIVLEDFHYLPNKVQHSFSRSLKGYFDYSDHRFVIIGVWLDDNKLLRYNGDLGGRISTVNADKWSRPELEKVISSGEELIGITFDRDFKEHILDSCLDSVWVVQQACYQACIEQGVISDANEGTTVGSLEHAKKLMDGIVQDQASRAESFIDSFSAGPTTMLTSIYRWTIFTVLACDIARLEGGLSVAEIAEFIGTFGAPVDPNLRDLIRELPEISEFQMHHLEISPIVLDYDFGARRLNVVDRSFLLWLSGQNRVDILRQAGMPGNSLRRWQRDVHDLPNSHHKGAAHPRKPVRAPRPVRPAPRPAADA